MITGTILLFTLAALNGVLSLPFHDHHHHARAPSAKHASGSELQLLFEGNKQFKANMNRTEPGSMKTLAKDGQKPPFLFLGCSDSRVSEGTIFNAKPGTLFAERNIANQFHASDLNSAAVVSYAVTALGVQHVIVMGHYGCGGVAAAIQPAPKPPVDSDTAAIQTWITPIRELFKSSTRPEIVKLRASLKNQTEVKAPELHDPGFRALVEENVKAGVKRIAATSTIKKHMALLAKGVKETRAAKHSAPVDVFIHGWVFDIENGDIHDLGVSIGPAGKQIPKIPFSSARTVDTAQKVDSKQKVAIVPKVGTVKV